jgi:hypothetical protein
MRYALSLPSEVKVLTWDGPSAVFNVVNSEDQPSNLIQSEI